MQEKHAEKAPRRRRRRGPGRFFTILLSALLAAAMFAAGYLSGRSRTLRAVEAETATELAAQGAESGAPAQTSAEGEDSSDAEASPLALAPRRGYFPCENGLFRPESPLTRLEAAELLYWLMETPPETRSNLSDVPMEDAAYAAASSLVSLGVMEAPRNEFGPDGAFTEAQFAALLEAFFPAGEVETAMSRITGLGSEGVSRAEAAVVLNELLGLATDTADAFFPDVEEGYWAYDALLTAGERSRESWEPGFLSLDGWLYYIQEDGCFLKNGYIGSLYFDANGRYTSGDAVLDEYVAAAIRENTTADMDRMEKLRALYLYVRDGFTYLRRNYYNTGDMGWALEEAHTMYTTGMGNCYNYAAAFWAAARGLGYDAMAVSGIIGSDHSKHGWVEIPMEDGKRYNFDVEIEMAYRRDGKGEVDMFALEHVSARYSWLYDEYDAANRAAFREGPEIFAPR